MSVPAGKLLNILMVHLAYTHLSGGKKDANRIFGFNVDRFIGARGNERIFFFFRTPQNGGLRNLITNVGLPLN